MQSLFNWIRTGFRTAAREGLQLGIADAMTAVTGGDVEFIEPARIEAVDDPAAPQETAAPAAAATKTKPASRKRSK